MPRIELKDWNLGGISDSKYSGLANSSYKLVGLNIHEEPGVLKVQQQVINDGDSQSLNVQTCRAIVPLSNGDTYFFGVGGAIYRRDSGANYTVEVASVSPDEGDNDILDAIQFRDSIYYTMEERIGKWEIGTSWATRDDNFIALEFDDEFHPLIVIENKLWVGNKNLVGEVDPSGTEKNLEAAAAVDLGGSPNMVRIPSEDHGFTVGSSVTITGTSNYNGEFIVKNVNDPDTFDIISPYNAEVFTGSETATEYLSGKLELESKFTIQSLGKLIDHLIIGTITEGGSSGSFSGFSHVFNWDLRSIDLTSDVTIPEFGVNAFIDYFGSIVIQAGKKGNLYSYNGQSASRFKRIPGDWGVEKEGIIQANAVSSYLGIPVFGFSNENDNPTEQGLYTLGGYDAKYPVVFNLDFREESMSSKQIPAVTRLGEDILFTFAATNNSLGEVKIVDNTTKETEAYLETQVININRDKLKNFKVRINYRSLPSGTDVQLSQQTNESGSYSVVTLKDWSNKKYLESDANILNATSIQFKLDFISSGNLAPEIESIIIDFNEER